MIKAAGPGLFTRQRLVLVVWGSCLPIAFFIGINDLLLGLDVSFPMF